MISFIKIIIIKPQEEKIRLNLMGAVIFLLLFVPTASGASVWEVKGFSAPVYLAGSIHVMERNDRLPDVYIRSLENCRQIVFEVHPEELEDPGQIRIFRKAGRLPEGTTLEDVLPAELMEKLKKAAGGRLSSLRHLQPWMAALRLVHSELETLGFDPRWGVDQRLYRHARERDLPVRGLETVGDQCRMFLSLDTRQQQTFLAATVDHLDRTEENLNAIMRAWRNGDLEKIAEFFQAGAFDNSPDLAEIFLRKRNEAWLPVIERIGNEGVPVMIVVGVGHLAGSGSLIDLLEKKGYACSRIRK